MYDTVVVATDGSTSVERAVTVAADLAGRFEAELHAVYVLDRRSYQDAPDEMQSEVRGSLEQRGEEALEALEGRVGNGTVTTAIREGRPPEEIVGYAREVDADVVATGTRGRHGEGRFILGSVAEEVVRMAPMPVLTVRRLSEGE
jgi:nucleotide-binding universal stress UspA family protein